jgi:hypothetical protein
LSPSNCSKLKEKKKRKKQGAAALNLLLSCRGSMARLDKKEPAGTSGWEALFLGSSNGGQPTNMPWSWKFIEKQRDAQPSTFIHSTHNPAPSILTSSVTQICNGFASTTSHKAMQSSTLVYNISRESN